MQNLRSIIHRLKLAGAELSLAQVKLKVIVEVEVGGEFEAFHYYSGGWWMLGGLRRN